MGTTPTITHHAFRRAKERLGMSGQTFAEWVRLTCHSWTQVNSTFLKNRNLNVSGGLAHYYINPLTSDRGVVLVLKDGCVLTVMDYYELKSPSPPKSIPDHELVPPPAIQRTTLLDKLVSRLCTDGIIDSLILKSFFKLGRRLDSEDIKYLVAYAEGQISYGEVMSVLKFDHRFRAKFFLETLEANGHTLSGPPVTSEIVFDSDANGEGSVNVG